jgi:hypothetical protein
MFLNVCLTVELFNCLTVQKKDQELFGKRYRTFPKKIKNFSRKDQELFRKRSRTFSEKIYIFLD